jgi:hypothetical protein
MFHSKNGLFFDRNQDGSVKIVVTKGKFPLDAPDEILYQQSLDADTWASVVSTVSKEGETSETFQQAREFHGD